MKSNFRAPLILCLVLPLAGGLSACTSESAPSDNAAMLPDNQRVSTVPWAKPEGWEGRNALGGLANDPRFSGGR